MLPTQLREIACASRLEHVRYAIRDLAYIADEVARQGHTILPLNIGDPITFDFETPPHLIEAVHAAMLGGKNGYAPSSGLKAALDPIRGHSRGKGLPAIREPFIPSGVTESGCLSLAAIANR